MRASAWLWSISSCNPSARSRQLWVSQAVTRSAFESVLKRGVSTGTNELAFEDVVAADLKTESAGFKVSATPFFSCPSDRVHGLLTMRNVLTRISLVCSLLTPFFGLQAQEQSSKVGVPVEVVATASEYVPRSTTISHPGHAYTDCSGTTSYFGRFDADTGRLSGTADTEAHCSSTYTPPSESTLTTYRRVNYTIFKDEHSLYLLSCTQVWGLTWKESLFIAATTIHTETAEKEANRAKGRWSECPAFGIGAQYTLSVRNASDARLEGAATRKPLKLEYLSSVPVPVPSTQPQSASAPQTQVVSAPAAGEARVHVTSSPSGGEIYVDGKFFGNTPSDITIATGEHNIRVALGSKVWSRSVQITTGEIRLLADLNEK
jgi:hypothetical protein